MSNSEEVRPEWMTSISGNVNPDDYLLGRKIDKTFELSQEERAEKAREERARLLASNKLKLSADPILELERRKQQLKVEIISNPMKLRQFRERLLKEEGSGGDPSRNNDHSVSDGKASRIIDCDRRRRWSRSGDRSRSRNDDERYRRHHDDRHRSRHRQDYSSSSRKRSRDSGKAPDHNRPSECSDTDRNRRRHRSSRDYRSHHDKRYSESSSSSPDESRRHMRHR